MKEKIHPTWYPEAEMTCLSCGTVWIVGATVPERRVDVCSNCHPFYTGEQRIMDTEGQVDRFYKRLQQRDVLKAQSEGEDAGELPIHDPIEMLEIGKRYLQILQEEGMSEVGQVFQRLQDNGDDGLLSISGIGRKVLSDIKRKLRTLGFELAFEMDEEA